MNLLFKRLGASSILRAFNQAYSTNVVHADIITKARIRARVQLPLQISYRHVCRKQVTSNIILTSNICYLACHPRPNNINAAGVVIRYWDTHHKVHIAIWMVIFIALSSFLHLTLHLQNLYLFVLMAHGLVLYSLPCQYAWRAGLWRIGILALQVKYQRAAGISISAFLLICRSHPFSIKVITLIGLIIFGIVVDLGGNPKHDRIGL